MSRKQQMKKNLSNMSVKKAILLCWKSLPYLIFFCISGTIVALNLRHFTQFPRWDFFLGKRSDVQKCTCSLAPNSTPMFVFSTIKSITIKRNTKYFEDYKKKYPYLESNIPMFPAFMVCGYQSHSRKRVRSLYPFMRSSDIDKLYR